MRSKGIEPPTLGFEGQSHTPQVTPKLPHLAAFRGVNGVSHAALVAPNRKISHLSEHESSTVTRAFCDHGCTGDDLEAGRPGLEASGSPGI